MNDQNFKEFRNQLIKETIDEMGEERAFKFFKEITNRDAINKIALSRTKIAKMLKEEDVPLKHFKQRHKTLYSEVN